MEFIKTIVLIIGPYILYSIILKWLENTLDLELDKFIKTLIFITLDIVLLMVFR
jgi:hypothetical protein